MYQHVDLEVGWDNQQAINDLRIGVYSCPSDGGAQEVRDPGGGKVLLWATTYGFNMGTWFVYNPAMAEGGDGPFGRYKQHAFGLGGQGVAVLYTQRQAAAARDSKYAVPGRGDRGLRGRD